MTESHASLRYRPELDGMRAVAVLLVVIFHVFQPERFSGFVGVDVFFALSGYLITTIVLAEIENRGSLRLRRFYKRRMLRLYPALLLMIICSFAFYRDLSGTLLRHLKYALIASTYTTNLYATYRHRWIDGLAHTWSLALEEQYYLIWPVVILLALRLRVSKRGIASAMLVAALVTTFFSVREFRYGSSATPIQSTSTGLLAGSALAVVLSQPQSRRAFRSSLVGGLGVLLFALELVAFSCTGAIPGGYYSPLAVLATVLVVGYTSVSAANRVTRVLSWAPAVWVGRISYGIYLWHYPLLLLVNRRTAMSHWALLPVVVALSIGVAALSYRYLETPFLRLKDRPIREVARGGTSMTA